MPIDKIVSKQIIMRTDPSFSVEERVAGGLIDKKYRDVFEIFKDADENLFLKIQPKKGNNILIQCENINDLKAAIEQIQLNIEKEKNDSGEYRLETTDEKRVEIDGFLLSRSRDKSILEKIEYIEKMIIEGLPFDESKKKSGNVSYDEIRKLVDTYVISTIDNISINGKKLEETDKVAVHLIEKAKINQNEEIIDFNSQGFGNEVQTCLMRYLYTEEISLDEEKKEALTYYKGAGFMKTNAFTRGNFKKVEKEYDSDETIEDMVEKLLIIEKIAQDLPERKYDIVLNRVGKGVGKSIEVGSENEYDSLVSFGTNGGTCLGIENNTIYKRVLKKDEAGIPADLLLPEAIFIDATECEMITLPFSYKVADYKKEDSKYQYITMGDIKEISLIDLVETRLKELHEYEKIKLEKIYESEKKLQGKTSIERENDIEELGYNEKEKIETILEDTSNALQKVKQVKMDRNAEKSESNKIQTFDENKSINPEELLGKIIEESKEKGYFSRIKGFASEIKRKIKESLGLNKESEKGDFDDGR